MKLFPKKHNMKPIPAKATIISATFLAITRQPLELENCSNLIKIRKVF